MELVIVQRMLDARATKFDDATQGTTTRGNMRGESKRR
jgi:hypothetical protein